MTEDKLVRKQIYNKRTTGKATGLGIDRDVETTQANPDVSIPLMKRGTPYFSSKT